MGRWVASWSPEEGRQPDTQTHTGMLKRERESWVLSLKRGRRVMVQAPRRIQSRGILDNWVCITSRTSLCCIACTRLFLFHPFANPYSPCLIFLCVSFFFTLPIPAPHHSQRHCPQNYPDSSLKSSAWNHHITKGEGGHYSLHCTHPHTYYKSLILLFKQRDAGFLSQSLFSLSLSVSVRPIPSLPLCLLPLLPLSQAKW